MQVHRSIENLPGFSNAVITIGTFDGVHEGHKKIIDALIREARSVQGEAIIVTFHPHPRKIVHPNEHLQLINTLEEKIELLQKTGIDHLVIVPFNEQFAGQTADEYIENFLIQKFQPHTIIIGYDHHFGKDRQGNFMLLAEKADTYNYRLLEIPKYILKEVAVSSTQIRNALLQSDVDTANKLLGYDFFFEGLIIEGDKLGRKLGYPTANLEYTDADKIHLGHGVFAVYAEVKGVQYKGMLSIGNRPTLLNSNERVEVNIFDFDEEIYSETIRVTVKKYLRSQEKYASLEELKNQLALDKENSLEVL
ncbi:MAG: bifunctional riboflavin kinase/FAD synthetase [Flavisolibacter sp.]|nr:bifunctional riboflavin kinase/FAD synthetase [Flavisolibacter sp.]